MKRIGHLASAAAVVVLVGAMPASAQPYPGTNYPQGNYMPGVGYANAYGAYAQTADRGAIDQCARAAEARVNADGGAYGNDGYGYDQQRYGQQGYGQSYDPRFPNRINGANGAARMVSVTRVDRRSNELRITGLIDSGMNANYGGYGNRGYGTNPNGTPSYDPNAGPRGERTDPAYRQQQINNGNAYGTAPYDPNNGFPPNGTYDQNNGPRGERTDPAYRRQQANNGFGYPQYGNPPYGTAGATADMQFECRITYSGAITRLRITRADTQRGY